MSQIPGGYEQRLAMLAKEMARKKAAEGTPAGLRTGSSQPPQKSPALRGVEAMLDIAKPGDLPAMGPGRSPVAFNYPPGIPKSGIGTPNAYYPDRPQYDPYREKVNGVYTGPTNVPGAIQAGLTRPDAKLPTTYPGAIVPPAVAPKPAATANPDANLMLLAGASRRPSTIHQPMTMPKPVEQSPYFPQQSTAKSAAPSFGNAALGITSEDRLANIQRMMIAERANAMASPREMDYWKLSPQDRAAAYAAKANSALNIKSLNQMGQDMTRAMNPVAPNLATPEQGAQSQQELLKAAGSFGKYGPEPDLALRTRLLAADMAPRKADAEAADAKALSNATMREGVLRKEEGRAMDQTEENRRLMMLRQQAEASGYAAQTAANSPDLIKAKADAEIAKTNAEAGAIKAQGDVSTRQLKMQGDALDRQSKEAKREADLKDPAFRPAANAADAFSAAMSNLATSWTVGGNPAGTDAEDATRALQTLRQHWPKLTEDQRQQIINGITSNDKLLNANIQGRPLMEGLKAIVVPGYAAGHATNLATGKLALIKELQQALEQMQNGTFGR